MQVLVSNCINGMGSKNWKKFRKGEDLTSVTVDRLISFNWCKFQN